MRFSIQKSISSHSLFHNYLFAFLLGFGALLIVYLPAMCLEHGYFLYYGDYNSQQLPFYSLANDAVRSGSFGWNWYTDLGANFIGSYAFYLLGSPFFWLTTILPRSWMLDATVYQAGSGTAIPAGTPLSSDQIQNRVNVRSDNVIFTAQFKQISEYPEDSEISTAEIVGATLSYNPGDAPRATAAVAATDQGKYRISDECWQELNENDEPVAIWHSNDGIYSTLPTITAFESGKKYVYSVLLLPERAYDFAGEVAATVNGNTVTAVPAVDG